MQTLYFFIWKDDGYAMELVIISAFLWICFSAVRLSPFCLWNKNAMSADNLIYIWHTIFWSLCSRGKKFLFFDLISFWEQNKAVWSPIFLHCQIKLSRATGIMSLLVCFTQNQWLQGIFFSRRKAGWPRTLKGRIFCVLALKQNQQSYVVPDRLV